MCVCVDVCACKCMYLHVGVSCIHFLFPVHAHCVCVRVCPSLHVNIIIITLRGLLALWEYMETQLGIDPTEVWSKIKDLVIKTILR